MSPLCTSLHLDADLILIGNSRSLPCILRGSSPSVGPVRCYELDIEALGPRNEGTVARTRSL